MHGHRHLDHTADLALEIWAGSEPDLLVEAARAVVAIMTEDAVRPAGAQVRRLSIRTLDAEDRLVQWINEVIILAVVDGFLVDRAELTLRSDGLDAVLHGHADGDRWMRGELKAATYHDLQLETTERGVRAVVVLDV